MERSMLLPELSVELIGRFSASWAASKATHSLPYKIRQQNQCMFTGSLLAERPSEASWHEYINMKWTFQAKENFLSYPRSRPILVLQFICAHFNQRNLLVCDVFTDHVPS